MKTKTNTCPICGAIANTTTGHACKHLVKVQANGVRVWRMPEAEPKTIWKILSDRMTA
jgi:hypothetical protein